MEPLQPIGWRSLGAALPPINWLIKPILKEGGMAMIAGASGTGKSQIAIQLCAKLALGAKEWAGFKINTTGPTQKILYLSLEMDERDVNEFTDKMESIFPSDVLDVLDKQVLFHATYEPFKLDLEPPQGVARRKLEQFLTATPDITGIVVDTLGAASHEGLLNDTKVRQMISWMKHLRAKYGVWIILLAHPRKEDKNEKRKNWSSDDIWGVQSIQADLDSIFIVTEVEKDRLLKLYNTKSRYGPKENNVLLRRNGQTLWLERSNEGIKFDEKVDNDVKFEDDVIDFSMEDDSWS